MTDNSHVYSPISKKRFGLGSFAIVWDFRRHISFKFNSLTRWRIAYRSIRFHVACLAIIGYCNIAIKHCSDDLDLLTSRGSSDQISNNVLLFLSSTTCQYGDSWHWLHRRLRSVSSSLLYIYTPRTSIYRHRVSCIPPSLPPSSGSIISAGFDRASSVI